MSRKLRGIRAVGFDLDDTLFMTEAVAFEMENEALVALGRLQMAREVHRATWGKPLLDAIQLRSPGVDIAAFEPVFARQLQTAVDEDRLDVLSDGAISALDALAARGLWLFIVTSRSLMEVSHLVDKRGHRLQQYVAPEWVLHGGRLTYRKPDHRVFDEVLAQGFAPEACAYVGDSISDGQATVAAGMHFVASLESGLRQPEDFAGIDVAAFINSLDELPDLIA